MKPHRPFSLLCFFLITVLLIPAYCQVAWGFGSPIDRKTRKAEEMQFLDKEIVIIPQLNKLTVGYGKHEDISYYFTKTLERLFFQDKTVKAKVTEIDFHDDGISLNLNHEILGPGQIRYHFLNPDQLETVTETVINEIILSALSKEINLKVVCDKKTKVFHLNTSNHLPQTAERLYMKIGEAEQQGYKKCGFCFVRMLYLPELSLEVAMEREMAGKFRYYNPISHDLDRQTELQKMGEKILRNWPFELIGYNYSFQLVESPYFNAVALPTGRVFVTSALFDSLEDKEEMEAILVHEIAHIEGRHSLISYKKNLSAMQSAQALAAIGGALAGAAAASGKNWQAGIAAGFAVLALTAQQLQNRVYPKELEREADSIAILHFQLQGKSKNELRKIFQKLGFLNLMEYGHPDIESPTHPYLAERIARVNNCRSVYFGNEKSYLLKRSNKTPIQMDIKCQTIFDKENKLSIYLNDYSLIERAVKDFYLDEIKLSVRDKNGNHTFLLDRDLIARDVWGAHLTFNRTYSSKPQHPLEDIGNISLVIHYKNEKPGGDPIFEDFRFVEGKISF